MKHIYTKRILDKYDFKSIQDNASVRLENVVQKVLNNVFKNIASLLEVCRCKIVKRKHLETLIDLSKTAKVFKQAGGSPLPTSYFTGSPDPQYTVDGISGGTVLCDTSSSTLARPALVSTFPSMVGGASPSSGKRDSSRLIPRSAIDDHARMYMAAMKIQFKIAEDAKDLIEKVVEANIDRIMRDVRRMSKTNTVTDSVLSRLLNQKKYHYLLAYM